MINIPTDEEVEEYIRSLNWREDTPDIHKTLVAGNIRAFYGWLKATQQKREADDLPVCLCPSDGMPFFACPIHGAVATGRGLR